MRTQHPNNSTSHNALNELNNQKQDGGQGKLLELAATQRQRSKTYGLAIALLL
jgi:hypothetical protein